MRSPTVAMPEMKRVSMIPPNSGVWRNCPLSSATTSETPSTEVPGDGVREYA